MRWIQPLALAALFVSSPALAAPGDVLLLDDASAEQLAKLDNVDQGMAEAIVSLRSDRGHIGSIEALRVLPGMTDAALHSLRSGTEIEYEFPTGAGKKFSSPDQVLSEFSNEPTIQQVQAWASDYAKINASMVSSWMAASQAFAAVPQLTLEYRFSGDVENKWRYEENVIGSPSEGVFDVLNGATKGRDDDIKVKVKWELSELIMSSERIRVINEAQDVVKLRDKVLTEVTRLYFERRRVQVDMLLSPKRDVAGQVKDQLHLMELTANLDGLTGGSFSAGIK